MPNPHSMILSGDRIVYYFPTIALGSKDGLQSFTAIGTVRDGEPYRADMGGFSLSGATILTAMQASAPFR